MVGVAVRVNLLVGTIVNEAKGGMVVAGVKLGEAIEVARRVGGGIGVTVSVAVPLGPGTTVIVWMAVAVS
jgi:hypothetical protein